MSTVRNGPPPARVAAWTRALLDAARAPTGRGVSVLLCGDARMRSLYGTWRGKDAPTDVLSFPSETRQTLGDIVVDVPYAARQARARGHAADREVQVLLAHG